MPDVTRRELAVAMVELTIACLELRLTMAGVPYGRAWVRLFSQQWRQWAEDPK